MLFLPTLPPFTGRNKKGLRAGHQGHEAAATHNKISATARCLSRKTQQWDSPSACHSRGMLFHCIGKVLSLGQCLRLRGPPVGDRTFWISISTARAPDGVSRRGADQPARAAPQSQSGPTDKPMPDTPLSPLRSRAIRVICWSCTDL